LIEQLPLLNLSNLGLTFLLLIEIASMKQALKEAEQIEYSNPPLIDFIHSVKP
jgi:hypothetical protein